MGFFNFEPRRYYLKRLLFPLKKYYGGNLKPLNMRLFFLALISIVLLSCSNPLENRFNKDSLEKDILELKAMISKEELNELVEYIGLSMSLGADINGKTYNELLSDIKTSKIHQKKSKDSFSRKNIQEILDQRLENHTCDELILEMQKKGRHKHNEKSNEETGWEDDIYSIDY